MFSKQTIENWYPFALGGNKYLTNGFGVPLVHSSSSPHFFFFILELHSVAWLLLFRPFTDCYFWIRTNVSAKSSWACAISNCNFHVLNALFSLTLVQNDSFTHTNTDTPNPKTIDKNAFGNGNTYSCAKTKSTNWIKDARPHNAKTLNTNKAQGTHNSDKTIKITKCVRFLIFGPNFFRLVFLIRFQVCGECFIIVPL